MQRSRSRRITVNSLSTGRPGATHDGEFHAAKVMMLGDFVRRHAADEAADAPAPERIPAALAKGRDLRGAVPAPRENHLLGAPNVMWTTRVSSGI
jgi:hypothetical protein